jgi:Holliday junction DNA helicase RuvA
MISQIRGILLEKDAESVVIEASGVGYEVFVPANVLLELGIIGEKVTLRTHLDVKEDSLSLYGFMSRDQLDMFRLLISVNKVGPRIAMNVLSVMDVDSIARSIREENVTNFTSVPGIGKKTGQRIILDLADKVAKRWVCSVSSPSTVKKGSSQVWSLARNALEAQGFRGGEIEKRLTFARAMLSDDPSIQELLSEALRYSGE